jgi:perosamine synthetase
MIPVNRPIITTEDIEAVKNALTNTWISGETPPVRELEENLANRIGVAYAVAVASGSTAIDLCIEALEIKPGDQCIVPAFTIISTVSNLMRKGAKLTLVDSDPVTYSMNSQVAAELIEEDTKLIMPVHIFGLPVDMDPVIEASNKHGTFMLEDAAEALGVKYKERNIGSLGNAAIFSFYANKIITGGEGGAVTTNSEKFANSLRSLRNLCFRPEQRYVHTELGWNARYSGLSATLVNSQLSRLDSLIEQKKRIGKMYIDGLSGHPWFSLPPIATSYSTNLFWVFGVVLNDECPFDASEFQMILRNKGVDSRRFFCPIHLQPVAKNFDIQIPEPLVYSEMLWERGLYLPSGLGNTDEEVSKVISLMWELTKS